MSAPVKKPAEQISAMNKSREEISGTAFRALRKGPEADAGKTCSRFRRLCLTLGREKMPVFLLLLCSCVSFAVVLDTVGRPAPDRLLIGNTNAISTLRIRAFLEQRTPVSDPSDEHHGATWIDRAETDEATAAKAVGLDEEQFLMIDSIGHHVFYNELYELDVRNEQYRITADIERAQLKANIANNRILGFSFSGVLMILITVIIYQYSRLLRERTRSLYDRIEDQCRLKAEMERMGMSMQYLRLIDDQAEGAQPGADANGKELFRRLTSYLRENKAYTDPGVNRRQIALILGTNEKYLSESIKKTIGLTFCEYITLMRLTYARLLLDSHPDYTVEAVATDAGFGSRNTFHRQFRGRYGLTPDEYRRRPRTPHTA